MPLMSRLLATVLATALPLSAAAQETLYFSAIPDEDETRLVERFTAVADYLSEELGVPVEFVPVKSYPAAVTAFRNDQVQLAWFGGLSGVQARLLDRHGRVPVLWGTMAAAVAGVLLIVYGGPLAVAGILLWGLGASLGFPVGMSAAADDERHAAVRVSVVSTIAYTAFLAGPPFLGFLGDHLGLRHALLVILIPILVALALAGVTRKEAAPAEERE